MEIKTVKINHPDKPGDYRIINEVDFDPARQELFDAPVFDAPAPESPASRDIKHTGQRRR